MSDPLDLARPDLRERAPYSSARMEAAPGRVMLDANESPWPPYGYEDGETPLNRYPQPQPPALVERLADFYGVDRQRVLVTRGSDEAIDLLVRGFCRAGQDAVLTCPPTFGMYAVAAGLQNALVEEVPLKQPELAVDTSAAIAAVERGVRVVFLASPNNPTGEMVPLETVRYLTEHLDGQALVVVDEAYVELADAVSVARQLPETRNLVVLRTLSKAFGLAGARCGALIGDPELVAFMQRILPPYPLPTPTVQAALEVLSAEGIADLHQRVARLRELKGELVEGLRRLSRVRALWPGQANFVLARVDDANGLVAALRERGIVIRDVSRQPGLAGCVRISVGTAEEQAELLAALEALDG